MYTNRTSLFEANINFNSLSSVALTLILCLLLPGCVEQPAEGANGGERKPVPVTLSSVEAASLRETVSGIGTLRAVESVEIRPEIAGLVREVAFEEGTTVEQNDLLYALDDTRLQRELRARQAALEAAGARLDLATQKLNRVEELLPSEVATPEDYDEAQADLREATAERNRIEAEIDVIREQIGDTTLSAPFDGMIEETHVDRGDFVSVGERMTTIYAAGALEMAFTIPERFMGHVQYGQPVDVKVDAFPERTFEGEVNFVSPAVNETTRDFLVKAKIPNDEGLLKPGAFGRASVTTEVLENRPVIPEEALVSTREGYFVFVVEDNVAKRRDVRIGLREPGRVEIREGVKAGEEVVRTGHIRLADGMKVAEGGNSAIQGPAEPREGG